MHPLTKYRDTCYGSARLEGPPGLLVLYTVILQHYGNISELTVPRNQTI